MWRTHACVLPLSFPLPGTCINCGGDSEADLHSRRVRGNVGLPWLESGLRHAKPVGARSDIGKVKLAGGIGFSGQRDAARAVQLHCGARDRRSLRIFDGSGDGGRQQDQRCQQCQREDANRGGV